MKILSAFIIFLPLFSFSLAAPALQQDVVSKRRIFNYEPDLNVEARHTVSSSLDMKYKRNEDTSLGVECAADELDCEFRRNEEDGLDREFKRNEEDGLNREFKRNIHDGEDTRPVVEFKRNIHDGEDTSLKIEFKRVDS